MIACFQESIGKEQEHVREKIRTWIQKSGMLCNEYYQTLAV